MSLIQIKNKAQITLPVKLRKILDLKIGDYLEIEIHDNKIMLKPVKTIDKDEAWFWKKEWQESECKADEDIKAGRYTVHDTPEDLIKSLRQSVCKSSKRNNS